MLVYQRVDHYRFVCFVIYRGRSCSLKWSQSIRIPWAPEAPLVALSLITASLHGIATHSLGFVPPWKMSHDEPCYYYAWKMVTCVTFQRNPFEVVTFQWANHGKSTEAFPSSHLSSRALTAVSSCFLMSASMSEARGNCSCFDAVDTGGTWWMGWMGKPPCSIPKWVKVPYPNANHGAGFCWPTELGDFGQG